MIKALALAVGLVALSAGAASANITVVASGVPGNPPQNLLLNTGQTGLSVTGLTNQTSTSVTISSNETLTLPSNGQARVEAADGAFTNLTIAPTLSGLGFTAMEFNINAATSGNATVQFFDQFGNVFGGVFALAGGGQNFFNAIATNGEAIVRAQISNSVAIQDVRQIRLGGVVTVPEPATWAMMILGMGMIGAGLRLRRRKLAPLAV
jgi:hypothetical protein